jgi:hypothetical protein
VPVIQTNSNLTIDPKVYSLKAVGDIELVSKTGTLTLKGYGNWFELLGHHLNYLTLYDS